MTTPDEQQQVWKALGTLQGQMEGVHTRLVVIEDQGVQLREEMAAGFKELRESQRREAPPAQVLTGVGFLGGGVIAGAVVLLLKVLEAF